MRNQTRMNTTHRRRLMHRAARYGAVAVPAFAIGMLASAESKPVIILQHDGCEAMMPDERDAGLRRAVGMMTERIREIPGEIQRMSPGQDAEMATVIIDRVLPLMTAMLEYPAEWAIIDNGINEFGVPDLDARILVDTGDPARAERLQTSMSSMFHMAMPNLTLKAAESNPNLISFPTYLATLLYGPADNNGTFVIGFDMGGDGLVTDRFELQTPSELGGIRPVYRMQADAQAMVGVMDIFINMVPDPNVKAQFANVKDRMPEEPILFQVAGGYRDGRGISITKLTNFKALQEWLGQDMPQLATEIGFISKDLLRAVPADARMATVASQNVESIINSMIQQMQKQSGGQVNAEFIFSQIEEEIGIHPMRDFVEHLGPDWVSYTADSTGGGGLMSFVFVNHGINLEGLQQTFDKLSTMANAMATSKAMGYVRCQSWDGGAWSIPGVEAGYTLTFPGVPVPMELSMAMTNDSLVAALTPQAVRTAVEQCRGERRGSLLDNPRFAEAMGAGYENVNKITFIDTPASISRGYATMQMLGTAVANFVRSPIDPTRDPGMIVPTYSQLTDGAHGLVQVAYMDGDDMLQYSTSDASWLVNIAGTLGAVGITPEVIGAAALGVGIGSSAR